MQIRLLQTGDVPQSSSMHMDLPQSNDMDADIAGELLPGAPDSHYVSDRHVTQLSSACNCLLSLPGMQSSSAVLIGLCNTPCPLPRLFSGHSS